MSSLLAWNINGNICDAMLTSWSFHVGGRARYLPDSVGCVRGLTTAGSGLVRDKVKAEGRLDVDCSALLSLLFFGVDWGTPANSERSMCVPEDWTPLA